VILGVVHLPVALQQCELVVDGPVLALAWPILAGSHVPLAVVARLAAVVLIAVSIDVGLGLARARSSRTASPATS
jgi:hypothetical protein